MALSYQNYTGDNVTDTFSIPFTYTDTSEISVTVDGVAQTGLTFPSASTVQLTSPPATSTLVQVRRSTDLTARAIDYVSGSVLTEEDLDNANIQVFHAAQEAVDKSNDGITLDSDDKFDAQSKVIKNVATPVDANDAPNKAYVDQIEVDATAAQTAAEAAQAAAETAETNAAASAATATTKASEASTSASNAATSASNSATSASSSSTSATASAASASAASASQAAAASSESNASTSETNAASSASSASTSAATATTQAGIATTKAGEASTSASNAATSESNAASSASSAASSASSASSAQTAAESARDATLAAYDSFDDRYLGVKSSDPTLDNDGNALVAGTLYFNSTDGSMKLYNGSAWVAAYVSGADYLALSGGTMTGDVSFGDNNKVIFGAGSDLQIYHDGTHSYIYENGTGSLRVRATEFDVQQLSNGNSVIKSDGSSAQLLENGSLKLETTSGGIDVTGTVTADGVSLGDGEYIQLGASNDLQIYHDGSNSNIKDNGTGNLKLLASNFALQNSTATHNAITYTNGGAVSLMHNNSKKFETSSNGAIVTGTLTATSFTGDGSSLTGIAAGATGGGSDEIFWENGQNVTTDYTITNGKNAMSAGPITINTGVTVTVGTGETWTVV